MESKAKPEPLNVISSPFIGLRLVWFHMTGLTHAAWAGPRWGTFRWPFGPVCSKHFHLTVSCTALPPFYWVILAYGALQLGVNISQCIRFGGLRWNLISASYVGDAGWYTSKATSGRPYQIYMNLRRSQYSCTAIISLKPEHIPVSRKEFWRWHLCWYLPTNSHSGVRLLY